MRKFRPLQEPIRLQDLLNSARSQAQKKINKDISVRFSLEMFDFLQQGSTRGALQYELTICVTMATYWVPDLHDIKGFSDHLKLSILFIANGVSSA